MTESSKRTWRGNWILLAAAALFSLAAAEAALRLLDLDRSAFRPHTPALTLRDYYIADPDLGVDIRPNVAGDTHWFADQSYRVFSNSLGCFDTDAPIPKDYILLIGDSVAWGFAPFDHKWGTRAEQLLGRRIVKCGVAGTGTRHQLIRAKRLIDRIGHGPGLIILGYTRNDFQDDLAFPSDTIVQGYRVRRTKRIDLRTGQIHRYTAEELTVRTEKAIAEETGPVAWLRRHSAVVNLAWRAGDRLIHGSRPSDGISHRYLVPVWDLLGQTPWIAPVWQQHTGALKELRAMAREHDARLLVLTHITQDLPGWRPVTQFLTKNGFTYFDVQAAIARLVPEDMRARLEWRRDPHWNIHGNRLGGALIARYLAGSGLIADLGGDAADRAEAAVREELGVLGISAAQSR